MSNPSTISWDEIRKSLGLDGALHGALTKKSFRRTGRQPDGEKMALKFQDIDPNGPWWQVSTTGQFGSVAYDTNWVQLGLEAIAIAGGPPRLYTYKDGCTKGSLVDFLEKVKATDPKLHLISKTGFDDNQFVMQFVAPHGCVELKFNGDSRLELACETNNQEFFDRISLIIKEDMSTKPPAGRVHVMVTTQYGPEFESMGIGGHSIVRENYTPEVLLAYDKIIEDLKSADPSGRLSIFNGPPGTGKTYLIRAILQAADNSICVVVPANLLPELSSPSVIPSLIELRKNKGKDVPIVFIVEDADECLVHRADGNMSAISAVLNLCDGILGSLLDIRVIATTNAKKMTLDSALIRPGRLSANVEVQSLSAEQSVEVLKRLNPALVLPKYTDYTLAELYNIAKGGNVTATGVQAETKSKMGF